MLVFNVIVWGIIFLILIVQFFRSIRLVPQRKAFIVERFGRYRVTLHAGFHALLPFVDKVAYKLDLREETIDVPPQECFTEDEVQVEVDGVMYISVVNAEKAAYGITNYRAGAMQLAQTTTRSVIGTLDLDQTFEERDLVSAKVVGALTDAGETWGIQVHRYEIKNISPPPTVQEAMEKQVTAERDRRAIVAKADGDRQARINRSEGDKMELINRSEGEMQRRINEAEGRAEALLAVARATADSINKVGTALTQPGGDDAIRLQVIEHYMESLSKLASPQTRVVLPADLSNFESMLKASGLERQVSNPSG